jgi:hypothetical protein
LPIFYLPTAGDTTKSPESGREWKGGGGWDDDEQEEE